MEPSEIRPPGRLRRVAVDLGPVRRHPAFRRLFVGQTVSAFGSEIAAVAAPFQLYQLTHSTLQVGLLSLTELVPLLLFATPGGALADAFDRRRVLLRSEVALAVVSGGLAYNASLAHPRVWALYLLAALSMSVFSLGIGSLTTVIPRLVEPHELAAANAIESVYSSTTSVAGPAAGGVLIAILGITGAFTLDAVTFAASLWSIWRLPALPPAHDAQAPSLRTIKEGLRFVVSRKVLLGMFLTDSNAMVFGMPRALFPALAANRFRGGASVLGGLYAAPYAGALLASLLSGWMTHARRQGVVVAVAAGLWGVAIAAFGFANPLWLALLLLAVAGAADNVSAVMRSTILFSVTPDRLRGRVSGIEFAQVASTPALGNVEAGVVASLTSVRTSIVSGGLACVAGTALIALFVPSFVRHEASRLEG